VVVSEAAFELNRILILAKNLTEEEVNKIVALHVVFAGGISICFGTLTPVFDEEKLTFIYVYKHNVHTFKLKQDDMEKNVNDALCLVTYLRETVCADGMWIETILNRDYLKNNTGNKLKSVLSILPTEAESSRTHKTKFTPPRYRTHYIIPESDLEEGTEVTVSLLV
jgi:hypothetical protein